jgi:hypothetical protein
MSVLLTNSQVGMVKAKTATLQVGGWVLHGLCSSLRQHAMSKGLLFRHCWAWHS